MLFLDGSQMPIRFCEASLPKGLNRATAKSSEAGLRGSEIPAGTQIVSGWRLPPTFPFFRFAEKKQARGRGALSKS